MNLYRIMVYKWFAVPSKKEEKAVSFDVYMQAHK